MTVIRRGHSAYETGDLAGVIDADLAAISATQDYALVNVGINDLLHSQTDWEQQAADMAYVLDAIHAKWPVCVVYLARVWSSNSNVQANLNYFDDTVIANALSGRSWAHLGVDERIVIKAGDNGATNTTDGTHYSDPAGYNAISNAWKSTMGL